MKSILVFDDSERILEELAEKYDVPVASIVETMIDELFNNDEDWKEHLDI